MKTAAVNAMRRSEIIISVGDGIWLGILITIIDGEKNGINESILINGAPGFCATLNAKTIGITRIITK